MDWLVKIRGKRSQYEVAREIGIPQSTYASIETGARRPSVTMAKKIAKVMGFQWTKFYEDQDEQENRRA